MIPNSSGLVRWWSKIGTVSSAWSPGAPVWSKDWASRSRSLRRKWSKELTPKNNYFHIFKLSFFLFRAICPKSIQKSRGSLQYSSKSLDIRIAFWHSSKLGLMLVQDMYIRVSWVDNLLVIFEVSFPTGFFRNLAFCIFRWRRFN